MQRLLLILFLYIPGAVAAQAEVERLLAVPEAPAGVVFEIVEGEEQALDWALPQVARLSARLRARFPGLEIAVVSHGREQFGLLADTAGPLAPIHAAARDLGDAGIDLHVCGVHAGWEGHVPEDFPDYVDVAASGPAQIRDYRRLGFEVIRLDPVSATD